MCFCSGVGVPVGSHTGARYVVMQLHYTDKNLVAPGGDHSGLSLLITSRTPRYISSVFLFTANARLPPHQPGKGRVLWSGMCVCTPAVKGQFCPHACLGPPITVGDDSSTMH